MRDIWYCDPDKNDKCSKTACFINGGPCHLTFDKTCAFVVAGELLKGPILHTDGGAENGTV